MPVLPPYGATVLPGASGPPQGDTWDPAVGVVGPFSNAGAPTNGAAGTFFGVAAKGALLCDTTNGTVYLNTGTLASPTWTQITVP